MLATLGNKAKGDIISFVSSSLMQAPAWDRMRKPVWAQFKLVNVRSKSVTCRMRRASYYRATAILVRVLEVCCSHEDQDRDTEVPE